MSKTALGTIQCEILKFVRHQATIQTNGSERIKWIDNEPTGRAANAYYITRHDLGELQDSVDDLSQLLLESGMMQQIILANTELETRITDIMQAESLAIKGDI